jgi:uncharacterized protein YggE
MKISALLAVALLGLVAVGCQGAESRDAIPPGAQVMGGALAVAQGGSIGLQGITVTGVGKVSVRPDMAVVAMTVHVEGDAVAQVVQQGMDAQGRLLSRLRAQGVKEEDVRTIAFNLFSQRPVPLPAPMPPSPAPGTAPGSPSAPEAMPAPSIYPAAAYVLEISIEVKVRDLQRLGALLQAAAQEVGDLLRVQGLHLSVANPQPHEEEARRLAMADARARAQQLAERAGVSLGRPVAITEGGVAVPFAAPAEARADVAIGTLDIVVTVTVVYEIG